MRHPGRYGIACGKAAGGFRTSADGAAGRRGDTPAMHPSASFSATLRVHLDNQPGSFARLASAIGEAGGLLGAIDLVRVEQGKKVRDITVLADGEEHIERIVEAVRALEGSRSSTSPTAPSCCTSVASSRSRRRRR